MGLLMCYWQVHYSSYLDLRELCSVQRSREYYTRGLDIWHDFNHKKFKQFIPNYIYMQHAFHPQINRPFSQQISWLVISGKNTGITNSINEGSVLLTCSSESACIIPEAQPQVKKSSVKGLSFCCCSFVESGNKWFLLNKLWAGRKYILLLLNEQIQYCA